MFTGIFDILSGISYLFVCILQLDQLEMIEKNQQQPNNSSVHFI